MRVGKWGTTHIAGSPGRLNRLAAILIAIFAGVWIGACRPAADSSARRGPSLTVFAAASMNEAISGLARDYEQRAGIAVKLSFAASSTLARQIQAGARADLFISANPAWVRALVESDSLRPASSIDLLGNQLVLIAPATSDEYAQVSNLAQILSEAKGRIAMGDPAHVPAGAYARQALIALGLWRLVEDRVLPAADVRGALRLVAAGEVDLGIVYRTDAASTESVRVLSQFPPDAHEPIVYQAAWFSEAGRTFVTFLQSAEARTHFQRLGFTTLF